MFIDFIKLRDDEEPFETRLDIVLGGWRLGYDSAWNRDVEEGESFFIVSNMWGKQEVLTKDVGKGFILVPYDERVL